MRRLLRADPHLTPREVAISKEVRDALRASHLPGEPRIGRVKHLMALLAAVDPRIGPRPATRAILTEAAASGYTAIYDLRLGFICEYDEEVTNLAEQLVPGTPDAERARRLKLKDVGTKAPLSLVCRTQTTDQGDLRRLVLRATRPKDGLVAAAGWPRARLAARTRVPRLWAPAGAVPSGYVAIRLPMQPGLGGRSKTKARFAQRLRDVRFDDALERAQVPAAGYVHADRLGLRRLAKAILEETAYPDHYETLERWRHPCPRRPHDGRGRRVSSGSRRPSGSRGGLRPHPPVGRPGSPGPSGRG